MTPNLIAHFPALGELEPSARSILEESTQVVILPPGAKAFERGATCDHYLMIAVGTVRVQLLSEGGREIVLYRVGGGETCVLTTACLLGRERYAAEAIVESAVEALVMPRAAFERLLVDSRRFRDFVFMSHAARITSLMLLVEEIAFGHVDARLARRLLERLGEGAALELTHQELAVELGTAREVVSRQLKEFERRGWILLERGRIEVLNRTAFVNLSGSGER